MMNNRKFQRAISTLLDAYDLDTDDPEMTYLLGESLYRMKQYEEAIWMYRESLRREPTFYHALHRLWAARLQNAIGTPELVNVKSEIRSEIQEITGREAPEPGLLFAAYMGYRYLDDRERRMTIIEKLAQSEAEGELKELISSFLFQELLTEPDNEKKVELSKLYLHSFMNPVETDRAAWLLVSLLHERSAGNDDFLASLEKQLTGLQENPYISFSIAYRLVEREYELGQAVTMLEGAISNMERQPFGEKTDKHIKEFRRRKMASCYNLLGWIYFKQGKIEDTLPLLEKSRALNESSEGLHYRLGMLYLSRGEQSKAIDSFKRSLEISDSLPGTEKELIRLLADNFGYSGKPNEYFSKKENIVTFSDVTETIGLSHTKALRVAWGDYDNDGYDDLLVSGPRLFKNMHGVIFVDVTDEAGLRGRAGFNGGIWGDYDNDGFLDLYLTSHGSNRLYKNNGRGGFTDVTMNAFGTLRTAPTEAAAWGDMDGDGFLDLYVANYEEESIELGICIPDLLWRNKGNGTFEDVTEEAGIVTDEPMCGRGVTWSDFNNDGKIDIMVSNYRLDPNLLWMKQQGLKFVDEGEERNVRGIGVAGAFGHTIGSTFGDFNGDGNLDIISANLAHSWYLDASDASTILINAGPPEYAFINSSKNAGITYSETHAEPSLADVDNDGDLDLYITSVYSGSNSFLYLNNGNGTFRDVSWLSGTRVKNGWGAAFSDFDNDGAVDLAVASEEGIRLLKNEGNNNHWLTAKIESQSCQSHGVGSRISLSYANKKQVREITAGSGTGTQDSSALTFGLGNHDGAIEIEVRTSCGDTVSASVPSPNQIITLTDQVRSN